MEIDPYNNSDEVGFRADSTKPSGGIYSLPVIGNAAAEVRQFYDNVAPTETDSTEVRIVKQFFRVGSAVTGMAAVAMIVL